MKFGLFTVLIFAHFASAQSSEAPEFFMSRDNVVVRKVDDMGPSNKKNARVYAGSNGKFYLSDSVTPLRVRPSKDYMIVETGLENRSAPPKTLIKRIFNLILDANGKTVGMYVGEHKLATIVQPQSISTSKIIAAKDLIPFIKSIPAKTLVDFSYGSVIAGLEDTYKLHDRTFYDAARELSARRNFERTLLGSEFGYETSGIEDHYKRLYGDFDPSKPEPIKSDIVREAVGAAEGAR